MGGYMHLVPKSEQEVAEIVTALGGRNESVGIRGGGSKSGIGQVMRANGTLCMRDISGVEQYNPDSLSLVVKVGTPVEVVQNTLAEAGQRLAFEPMDYRQLLQTETTVPTIGGVVACGISGPARISYGACRDSLLGVRFVNGRGEIIKNGGQVMKNVTGYDLVKFMCGSYGTLGVLTELSFKTAPIPEYEATINVGGMSDEDAIRFLSEVLQRPLDVTGAAHCPLSEVTCVRIEGIRSFVETRVNAVIQILKSYNVGEVQTVELELSRTHWQEIRDVTYLADRPGDVWRISLKPTDGPEYIARLKEQLSVNCMYDWGGGLIWLNTEGKSEHEAVIIRSVLAEFGGHAMLVRAGETKRSLIPVFQPEPEPLAKIAKEIKKRFDPHNVLNPGLMDNPVQG